MNMIFRYVTCCLLVISLMACKQNEAVKLNTPDWAAAQALYLNHLKLSIAYLDSLQQEGLQGVRAKELFQKARLEFKQAEPYASYLNPEVGHRVNGPALPVFKEDNGKVSDPVGLQKIEESVFEQETTAADFEKEIKITKGLMAVLQKGIEKRDLNPQRFFIATHQQLLRIISHGISGFDTPVSHFGLHESAVSLQNLEDVYGFTLQAIIQEKDAKLDTQFVDKIAKAVTFLNTNIDFDAFDRFTFIRDYLNPITRDWVAIRKTSDLWEVVDTEAFNFEATTFFDADAFNLDYFATATNKKPSAKQIELGEKLFFEPKLSEKNNMSCATCHQPEKAYADGLVVNFDNKGQKLLRNTPTLLNVALQQNFFWDGRSETLQDQIASVFTNEKEFDSHVHQFSNQILQDSSYIALFQDAYGKIPKKNTEIIKAISSYIATLNGFNSKFDRNIRGEEDTFTKQEQLGFNLFMGKALCATCHFMPLTNGTVPPFFKETEREVIGVPKNADNKSLDTDEGFYWKYKQALHKGMFKTPTVRNSNLTAPYMHNGVYQTLEEVINFYKLGGGGGLGFDVPHQTLPFDALDLSSDEEAALVAYLKTLDDNEPAQKRY
uniref:cytochrome c peroxidase n=1 Tax=Flavobacterium sp. TaxID=239 RepID=UPI004048F8DF